MNTCTVLKSCACNQAILHLFSARYPPPTQNYSHRLYWCSSCACALSSTARHALWSLRLVGGGGSRLYRAVSMAWLENKGALHTDSNWNSSAGSFRQTLDWRGPRSHSTNCTAAHRYVHVLPVQSIIHSG